MASSSGGAVFLSNVDDYLSPSQACVNPLYNSGDADGDRNDTAANKAAIATSQPLSNTTSTTASIIPKTRRRRPRLLQEETRRLSDTIAAVPPSSSSSSSKSNKVTASIADCLACSGCVTTAETVLLQDHSIDKLKQVLFLHENSNASYAIASSMSQKRPRVIATISPASMADLIRLLFADTSEETEHSNEHHHELHVIRLLIRLFHLQAVLDGNLALLWSLQNAAREFIDSHKQKRQDSERHSNHGDSNAAVAFTTTIASTCPAVVCLVEKNHHDCVELLSPTKSAFAAAAQALQQVVNDYETTTRTISNDNDATMDNAVEDEDDNQQSPTLFHLAVMPCHDKKLEATRLEQLEKDDSDSQAAASTTPTTTRVKTMVITTEECWTLLQEQFEASHGYPNVVSILEFAKSLPSPTQTGQWSECIKAILKQQCTIAAPSFYITQNCHEEEAVVMELELDGQTDRPAHDTTTVDPMDVDIDADAMHCHIPVDSQGAAPFVYSSGGYADFIFRQAAQELYGVKVQRVPWQPATQSLVSTVNASAVVSARVARSRAAQRDFWQAILCEHVDSDGQVHYSTDPVCGGHDNNDALSQPTPVLRFAMAHGLQTMQRAISTDWRSSFDYIEAMACPSGCLNGGGQVRMASSNGHSLVAAVREMPRDTRVRLQTARRYFVTAASDTKLGETASGPQGMMTRFRKVPPMQLSMGAGKGTAVKDIQW